MSGEKVVPQPNAPSNSTPGFFPPASTSSMQPQPPVAQRWKGASPPPPGFITSHDLPPKLDNTFPDLPTVPDSAMPTVNIPGGRSDKGEDIDFDDLTRRFEALKKKK